ENFGIDTADISVEVIGAAFSVIATPPSVPEQAPLSVPLLFVPPTEGFFAGLAVVHLGCGRSDTIWMIGHGSSSPQLAASRDTIEFGNVRVHSAATSCVNISNGSCLDLELTADSIDGLG